MKPDHFDRVMAPMRIQFVTNTSMNRGIGRNFAREETGGWKSRRLSGQAGRLPYGFMAVMRDARIVETLRERLILLVIENVQSRTRTRTRTRRKESVHGRNACENSKGGFP